MMQPTEVIDIYCLAWSEPHPKRRRALLEMVWTETSTYTDPGVRLAGIDALDKRIAHLLAKRRGSRVVRTSELDMHHDLCRFSWCVEQADGTSLPQGLDVAAFCDPPSRLAWVIGFFSLGVTPLRRTETR